MEFIQENQRTILIVLAVLAVLYLVCRQGYINCSMKTEEETKPEGYQANNTTCGRGLPGRGLTGDKLVPSCYKAKENHYLK